MTDLVTRLRLADMVYHPLNFEAANEIERLRNACLMYDRKLHEKDLLIDACQKELDAMMEASEAKDSNYTWLEKQLTAVTKERDEARALAGRTGVRELKLLQELTAVTRERDELRYGNAIKYGTSHPEMYKTELDYCKEQLAARQLDAEIWVPVSDYVGYYEVSSKGRVRSVARVDSDGNMRQQKYLHPTSLRKGHLKVTLWKDNDSKEFYVHRLVASAFVASDVGCNHVNHKDGDPINNEVSNLEWVTNKQNAIHSARVLGRAGNKPVVGRDINTLETIRFDSIQQAGEAGFSRANILKCINGERRHAGGYVWKFDAAIDQAMKEQRT